MTAIQTTDSLKWDEDGLIPAIVQDAASKQVLMMAYMNEQSLKLTIESKETWFWSRSRQALWHKGETSGHTQKVVDIYYDCDADTLLILAEPQGPACHTGEQSCFYKQIDMGQTKADGSQADERVGEQAESQTEAQAESQAEAQASHGDMLATLEAIIAKRDIERPDGAYTTYLFEQGIDKILKKVGEEAAEVIIAAKNKDNEELRNETSDLIYHLMVLLREAKLPLQDVLEILEARHKKG